MTVTIHQSGQGADALRVDSWYNGGAYHVTFGEAGGPMRSMFFQDDNASSLREELNAWETAEPETPTRDLWLRVLDPYL